MSISAGTTILHIILTMLRAFAPTLAALSVTGFAGGWIAVSQLLSQALIFKAAFIWYIIALFPPAIMVLAATCLHVLFGGKPPVYPRGRKWFNVG